MDAEEAEQTIDARVNGGEADGAHDGADDAGDAATAQSPYNPDDEADTASTSLPAGAADSTPQEAPASASAPVRERLIAFYRRRGLDDKLAHVDQLMRLFRLPGGGIDGVKLFAKLRQKYGDVPFARAAGSGREGDTEGEDGNGDTADEEEEVAEETAEEAAANTRDGEGRREGDGAGEPRVGAGAAGTCAAGECGDGSSGDRDRSAASSSPALAVLLRSFYEERGIAKSEAELAKVVSYAERRGLSALAVMAQLEHKYGAP